MDVVSAERRNLALPATGDVAAARTFAVEGMQSDLQATAICVEQVVAELCRAIDRLLGQFKFTNGAPQRWSRRSRVVPGAARRRMVVGLITMILRSRRRVHGAHQLFRHPRAKVERSHVNAINLRSKLPRQCNVGRILAVNTNPAKGEYRVDLPMRGVGGLRPPWDVCVGQESQNGGSVREHSGLSIQDLKLAFELSDQFFGTHVGIN